MLSILGFISSSFLLSRAYASTTTTHDIDVGRTRLVFEPETVHASIGDIINFHFYPINHSVAQSTFEQPCQPLTGGVGQTPLFSGFLPVEHGVAADMFSMRVNSTDPMWLYCSQPYHDHCVSGQAMVINPLPNSDQTLKKYKETAKIGNTNSPSEVFGGVVVANVAGAESTISTSSSTSLAPASASANDVAGRIATQPALMILLPLVAYSIFS